MEELEYSKYWTRKEALKEGYKPLVIDGFNKILSGYTTLKELNSKLVIY